MEEHLEYTRADDQRITRMETLMVTMDKKIDTLGDSIKICQNNCVGNRSGYSKRLKSIEDRIRGETFVKSWKDALFSKSTAIVLFIIAVVDFVSRLIPWGR
jgi:hypothetical protein